MALISIHRNRRHYSFIEKFIPRAYHYLVEAAFVAAHYYSCSPLAVEAFADSCFEEAAAVADHHYFPYLVEEVFAVAAHYSPFFVGVDYFEEAFADSCFAVAVAAVEHSVPYFLAEVCLMVAY